MHEVHKISFMIYTYHEDHRPRAAQEHQLDQTIQLHFLHILCSDTSDQTSIQKPNIGNIQFSFIKYTRNSADKAKTIVYI